MKTLQTSLNIIDVYDGTRDDILVWVRLPAVDSSFRIDRFKYSFALTFSSPLLWLHGSLWGWGGWVRQTSDVARLGFRRKPSMN